MHCNVRNLETASQFLKSRGLRQLLTRTATLREANGACCLPSAPRLSFRA